MEKALRGHDKNEVMGGGVFRCQGGRSQLPMGMRWPTKDKSGVQSSDPTPLTCCRCASMATCRRVRRVAGEFPATVWQRGLAPGGTAARS